MRYTRPWLAILAGTAAFASAIHIAQAADCPANPNALGVSRVLTVDPTQHPLVGSFQYRRPLPLERGEVVLTFDDGPLPPATPSVLDTLKRECVKALFFLVGRNANAHPDLVREIRAAGHTIGTHTQTHPFGPMAPARARREISRGIGSVQAALGEPQAVAPYFRFPGLFHTRHAQAYLRSRGIAAWGIDIDSDDWRRIGPRAVLHRTLARLEARGRGILLMHDIHRHSASVLPLLLSELKARGYRVVHVVPAATPQPQVPPPEVPTPAPEPPKSAPDIAAAPASPAVATRIAAAMPAAPTVTASIPTKRIVVVRHIRPVHIHPVRHVPHVRHHHQHRRVAWRVDSMPRRRTARVQVPEFRWAP